jgi:TIR domain
VLQSISFPQEIFSIWSAHDIGGVNKSRMSHDVFISHARKDKGIADALCEKLESARVRCWIADRDISVGEDWTEVTRKAIGSSRVMVLVLSENANAAPHIEREIAHAFYTGRMIIPLRVTDTLPRRDFLFYLGNVRCFDAFSPPAEQHLEAFTASVNGLVRGPATTGEIFPPERPIRETRTIRFSDSWIGALHASHYRTLELLKRAAIAVGIVVVGLLLWFAHWQTERENYPLAHGNRQARLSDPGAAPDSRPQVPGSTPLPKPTYTYSRLGLWVASNNGATTADQPPEGLPTSSVPQTPDAAASPGADPDEKQAAGTENIEDQDDAGGSRPRLTSRQEVHRRKERPKRHSRRVASSDESFVGHIKRRLKSVWRKMVVENR